MGEISKTVRIPCVVDLEFGQNLASISGSPINFEYMSYMKNLVADKASDGTLYARVRPTIDLVTNNSTADTNGRGIFYWEENDTTYWVNAATVYRTNYSTSVGSLVSPDGLPVERVYFTQVGNRLMVIDVTNDNGYTIQTNHTFTQITDAQFPTGLVHGAVTLNGRGYVLTGSGEIYNSALEDATSWTAVDFTEAERYPDAGRFIEKHHDHIVVAGSQSIEFFYDNSENQPVASPLRRREDVQYNIGAVGKNSFCRFNDTIFFVGKEGGDNIGVFKIENFGITKVSKPTLDGILTQAARSTEDFVMTIIQGRGKTLVLLTVFGDVAEPLETDRFTVAYDVDLGLWSLFESALSPDGLSLPFIAVTQPNAGFISFERSLGIFPDGDIYEIEWQNYTDDGQAVEVEVVTGWQDGGTNKYKYCRSLELVANAAADTTVTVSYSDTTNLAAAYTVSRTLSVLASIAKRKLTRLGRFLRRNFRVTASVSSEFRIQAIEVEVALGDH